MGEALSSRKGVGEGARLHLAASEPYSGTGVLVTERGMLSINLGTQ